MYIFTPQTDEQIALESLPSEGRHRARITKAQLGTSQQGNKKIDITLVINDGGVNKFMWDTLMFEGRMKFKFKHALQACGLNHMWESGKLDTNALVDKEPWVNIIHRQNTFNGKTTLKATVDDYLSETDTSGVEFKDDNIPF